jgi:hypothetical protein
LQYACQVEEKKEYVMIAGSKGLDSAAWVWYKIPFKSELT